MEVRAVAKYVRVQPRKVRIVAREVKGGPALYMASKLEFHPSKGAEMLRKVLVSAIANAVENHGANANALRIASISVDEGPRIKRITQKAMGRGARILKKTSHITVVVEDYAPQGPVKPHGTKAKSRPKFEVKKTKAKAEKVKEEVVEEVVVTEETPEVVEATAEETTEVVAEETAATDEAPAADAEEAGN